MYDRYFREQNIKKSDIQGVFTLGKDSVAIQEEIAQLKEDRDRLGKELSTAQSSLDKFTKNRDDARSNAENAILNEIYKAHKDDFNLAFKGFGKDKKQQHQRNEYKSQ